MYRKQNRPQLLNWEAMTSEDKPKRGRGRPEKPYPEQIDASPEEIARVVLKAKPKKDWRYVTNEGKTE